LLTSDPAAAQGFYKTIVGWGTAPWGNDGYVMWMSGQTPVGGVMALPAEVKATGVPPHWLVYISTPDADATARRAEQLDKKIGEMKSRIDAQMADLKKQYDEQGAETQKKYQAATTALKEKRGAAQKSLADLKSATGEAWEKAREKTAKALDDLQKAYDQAVSGSK
jgi:predicted enzyme related to lactoylglutathione lyase